MIHHRFLTPKVYNQLDGEPFVERLMSETIDKLVTAGDVHGHSFTVDQPAYVSGRIEVKHTGDLRPGLKYAVRIDNRIVAAPMVRSDPWKGVGNAITGPSPDVEATGAGAGACELDEVYVPSGTHRVEVVAPQDRAAGQVGPLELSFRPAPTPRYSFAMISDTHLTDDIESEWMNRKMGHRSAAALTDTLGSLAEEGIRTILFGGDLTDRCRGGELAAFGVICREAGISGFGCLGNHDLYDRAVATAAVTGGLSDIFPGGRSSYTVRLPSLDLVVLDSESLANRETPTESPAGLAALREADSRRSDGGVRPIVVMRHYPLRNRGGFSSAGFELPNWSTRGAADDEVVRAVRAASVSSARPLLFLNGHTHWTESVEADGGLHLQNPAFCEWPCCYRVFHVESNAVRYELRQVADRSFVADSQLPAKRLTWMISTGPRDRCGVWPAAASSWR